MTAALVVGFVAVLLVVWVVIPGIVYLDAERNGVAEPKRWAAIVGASCGTGLLVYLLERDDARHESEADPFALPGSSGALSRDDDRE